MMKRLLLTGLAVIALTVSALEAQDPLRRADKQFELKAYVEALNGYQLLYNDDQDNEALEAKVAACYEVLGNDVVAAAWYARIQDQSVLSQVAIDYGKVLKRLGEYDKAKSIFALAIPINREVAESFMTSCDYAKMLMQDDYIEVYPASFNTTSGDFGLTFKGDTPVFCSFDDNLSFIRPTQKSEGNRLYTAEDDDLLGIARAYNLRPATKVNYGLGPVAYQGKQCAYVRNFLVGTGRQITATDSDASIYLATSEDSGDFSKEAPFAYNETDYATTHPCFSADGRSLYFASNCPGGFGGYDIYRSDYKDGQWSPPVNLGDNVNTQGNEVTPALMKDKLVFASDFHLGLGGFDLFSSLIDGEHYLVAENMGHGINSPADDYYPTIKEGINRLYFTSDRLGGKGKEDIYVSERLSEDIIAPPAFVINATHQGTTPPSNAVAVATEEQIIKKEILSRHVATNYSIDEALAQKEPRRTQTVAILDRLPVDMLPAQNITTAPAGRMVYVHATMDGTNDIEDLEIIVNTTEAEIKDDIVPQASPSNIAAPADETAAVIANTPTREVPAAVEAPAAYQIPDLTEGSSPVINESVRTVADLDVARRVWSGSELPPAASVYFVQLAAFSKRSINLTTFEGLVKFGNIYKVYQGAATKVRLGYFTTEEEARQALRKVKANGYRDAFLTFQPLDINNLELVYSSYDYDVTSKKQTTTSKSKGSNTQSDNLTNDNGANAYEPSSYMVRKKWDGNSRYKVRLASYEDPKFFDLKRADDLGRIEQWTKGGWTIFLTSGYKNLEEAEAARRKAVNKGFRDAEVVLDNDGILERLKKN